MILNLLNMDGEGTYWGGIYDAIGRIGQGISGGGKRCQHQRRFPVTRAQSTKKRSPSIFILDLSIGHAIQQPLRQLQRQ